MAEFFLMPKLGMDMEEGVIARWLKNEGDSVSKGELLAEIETDKASVEVESPASGTVLKLYYETDSGVACGTPIAYIGQPGDTIPSINSITEDKTSTSETATTTPTQENDDRFFLMPKLGMDMEEGIIGRWLKSEGDTVNKGEILAEIETDKAAVEVESPRSGIILKLYYPEGTAKECGLPIAYIGNPGDIAPDATDYQSLATGTSQQTQTERTAESSDIFFRMPKLGMDMEEGTIVQWLKAEGDHVEKGEPLVEIETDKAAVTSESNITGTILKIFYPEDEAVPCGEPIAAIGAPGSIVPDPKKLTTPATQPQTGNAIADIPIAPPPTPKHQNGRIIASPRARRCAAQNNISLSAVLGTGENGRIVEQDVLDHVAAQATNVVRIPKDEVVPLSGMRKVIASRMRNSLQEMAQTNTRMDVDMTNMIAFRKQLNDRLSKDGIKVSYVDLLVAVCAKALIENPLANASLESDGIHYKNYANIGIAVDAAKGLVVPVIKDADIRTIPEISQISKELINKARDGALRPDDMKGGTFTISNLGMFEVDSFTAIVNPPETCILAVGRIAEKPVVVDGQIVVRSMMNLCLSYDHRVIDGAPSARFLQCIKHYIENPVWLLM